MVYSTPALPSFPLYADIFYEGLEESIKRTQSELKEGQQLILCYYDQAGRLIFVEDIGYSNPFLIILFGKDTEGNKCNVFLHMAALQLVAKIVSGTAKNKPRPLGFLGEVKT